MYDLYIAVFIKAGRFFHALCEEMSSEFNWGDNWKEENNIVVLKLREEIETLYITCPLSLNPEVSHYEVCEYTPK